MTESKRPLKVFLCHAHADRDSVRGLYARLTNDGVDAWLDKAKLLPGQDWELEIRKAVREADVVVVCLSKQFNQAGFRQKEVRLALDTAMEKPEGEIFIIPARLEECDTLESLRKWHWVDLFEEDGYESLMRALQVRASNIGATLQIKRSWLPKIISPLPKKQKPVENKTTEVPGKKIVKNIDGISPSTELPDGWESQWQAAFVKNAKEEKESIETTDTKDDIPSEKKIRKPNITIVIGFIVLVLASILSLPSLIGKPEQTPAQTPISTQIHNPTKTLIPPTKTLIPPTFTPTLGVGSFILSDEVPMMYVPDGPFSMGSNDGSDDESPVHAVTVDAFYMDKYEVTNSAYQRCVDAGACDVPKQRDSSTRTAYFGNPEFNDHPVIYVDWNMAKTYCEWRGANLPTEAQWEKAARGTDGRTYPWGEGLDCNKANYFGCIGDTTEVGSYENGKSPYGMYDMAGNVWEWVSDWYDAYPGNTGSNSGYGTQYRVLRGGSWNYVEINLRASNRSRYAPDLIGSNFGFRCVRSFP